MFFLSLLSYLERWYVRTWQHFEMRYWTTMFFEKIQIFSSCISTFERNQVQSNTWGTLSSQMRKCTYVNNKYVYEGISVFKYKISSLFLRTVYRLFDPVEHTYDVRLLHVLKTVGGVTEPPETMCPHMIFLGILVPKLIVQEHIMSPEWYISVIIYMKQYIYVIKMTGTFCFWDV